jgi:CheY-like chemotaxis protein
MLNPAIFSRIRQRRPVAFGEPVAETQRAVCLSNGNFQLHHERMSARRSVLVVEDDKDIREILRDILSEHGYAVYLAANQEEAFEIMRRIHGPSIILLDLRLAGASGRDFLCDKEKDPSISNIPIIVMTGESPTPKPSELPDHPRFVLQKPFSLGKLVKLVDANIH